MREHAIVDAERLRVRVRSGSVSCVPEPELGDGNVVVAVADRFFFLLEASSLGELAVLGL